MAGYVLLPPVFAEYCREGKSLGDDFIAVMPVLIAYDNPVTRKCWPSLETIRILAGVRQEKAKQLIERISVRTGNPNGWLHIQKKPIGNGRTQYVYELLYPRYSAASISQDWIKIDKSVILKGLWAVMPPTTRRVYLTLRARGLPAHRADGEWLIDADNLRDAEYSEHFLPASYWGTSFLMEKTGIPERTIRESKAWIRDAGMAYPTTVEDVEAGMMMPFNPQRRAPKVLAALNSVRSRNQERGITPAASGYAKRDIRQLQRAASQAQPSKKGKLSRLVVEDAAENE